MVKVSRRVLGTMRVSLFSGASSTTDEWVTSVCEDDFSDVQRHIAVLVCNRGFDQPIVELGVVLPNAFVELRDWLEKDVSGLRESLHQLRRAGKNADVDDGGYGDLSFDKNFSMPAV